MLFGPASKELVDALWGVVSERHSTYLHRAVPIFFDTKPVHLAAANYVVGSKTEKLPPGWRSIHTDGGNALYQRAGGCAAPPPDWTMNLP